MQMILEQWPGGRWFRDRGNGIGHLWGHVQVIKPPVLLELSGPLLMSYPAMNHIEVRLDQIAEGAKSPCGTAGSGRSMRRIGPASAGLAASSGQH